MTDVVKEKDSKDKNEELITFKCEYCKLEENVHYKGVKPPFAKEILLKEESYVMKDPFSQPGRGQILIIGGDCFICQKSVCLAKECSVFYSKLICKECAKNNLDMLPVAVKNKIK